VYFLLSRKDIEKEVKAREDEVIEWLKELVRFPSENRFPDGDEADAQKFVEKQCLEIGLKTDMFTPLEVEGIKEDPSWLEGRNYPGDRKNIVAKWDGNNNGRSLLLTGHVDVAPYEPDDWKVCRPYEPVLKDGKLYGRGTADMKGGLAASYWAIRILKDLGFEPGGDVIFESLVDEEFAGGNGTLASRLKGYNADMAILTEPSRMQFCNASFGALLGDILLKGKSGMPFMGNTIINPIDGAARVIEYLREWEVYWKSKNSHRLFKGPDKELKVIIWDIDSKVPGEFNQMGNPLVTKVSWIVFTYPGISEESFYREFDRFWEAKRKDDKVLGQFDFEIIPTFHYVKPWESDGDNEGIKALLDVVEDHSGSRPKLEGASLSCDMAIYGDQGNMPVVIFGPRGDNLHAPDEWVLVEDILSLTSIFAMFIGEWSG